MLRGTWLRVKTNRVKLVKNVLSSIMGITTAVTKATHLKPVNQKGGRGGGNKFSPICWRYKNSKGKWCNLERRRHFGNVDETTELSENRHGKATDGWLENTMEKVMAIGEIPTWFSLDRSTLNVLVRDVVLLLISYAAYLKWKDRVLSKILRLEGEMVVEEWSKCRNSDICG